MISYMLTIFILFIYIIYITYIIYIIYIIYIRIGTAPYCPLPYPPLSSCTSCAIKVEVDLETGIPKDELAKDSLFVCSTIGSTATTYSQAKVGAVEVGKGGRREVGKTGIGEGGTIPVLVD